MSENFKALLIGIIIFIIGIFVSQIGVFSSGDAYITSITMIQNSILFLASVVSITGYLAIKELKLKNRLIDKDSKKDVD